MFSCSLLDRLRAKAGVFFRRKANPDRLEYSRRLGFGCRDVKHVLTASQVRDERVYHCIPLPTVADVSALSPAYGTAGDACRLHSLSHSRLLYRWSAAAS